MGKIIVTALMAAMAFSMPASARDMVQVKGSDTLINLVQRMSEVYMEENPGKYVSVTGGGSGTGIAAIINGRCDIANASRLIKSKEVDLAVAQGVDPRMVTIAIDGLSIIVNRSNPVEKLTMDQVGKIYRGEVTNWKDLGGEDRKINLYGRQPNSGTYDFMKEVVMNGDYASSMKQMNGNAQIVEAVKVDVSGIGYVGVGYVKDAGPEITVLKIARTAGGYFASPLVTEDVKSGKYPISRPLVQYVSGTPKGDIRSFIEFELSPEGQKIVEEEGFFSLSAEYVEYNNKQML
ncbi:MAG: PstS family phosphate ABC transporter substrate-binding protein [Candidatus Omnitrophica bacterium]|nr:PstS family phosphate ABC transporter substrate-binding protein [Candidatus Omnitrophota bacterium]